MHKAQLSNKSLEDVPLVEFMYRVFICMPGGRLCCCVPCVLSAVNSRCLLFQTKRSADAEVYTSGGRSIDLFYFYYFVSSALDTESERLVQEALDKVSKGMS